MSRISESPLTGQYVTGARSIPLPDERRRLGPRWITLTGAREHNLQDVDVRIPLGALTVVTGVSGSGKSTLVHDVLYRALETHLVGEHSAKLHLGEKVGEYETITGFDALEDVVMIDQSPIGKSPRSNPVTYVKAFDEIRQHFRGHAARPSAQIHAGHVQLQRRGRTVRGVRGRRRARSRDGVHGRRLRAVRRMRRKALQARSARRHRAWKEHPRSARTDRRSGDRFFPREEKLGQALWQLQQVGLGYLRLGQPATTLSGGEAQRIKIARELALAGKKSGKKMYVMDEPTTGLHLEDIRKLAKVFDRLLEQGHTLVLIEHNLDVIKLADWIIDLGPEGGIGGGRRGGDGTPGRSREGRGVPHRAVARSAARSGARSTRDIAPRIGRSRQLEHRDSSRAARLCSRLARLPGAMRASSWQTSARGANRLACAMILFLMPGIATRFPFIIASIAELRRRLPASAIPKA